MRLGYLFIIIMMAFTACRKDFDYTPSSGQLKFSKDTVYLDTVFTGISTTTKTLKVYNPSNDDVQIPKIFLEKGEKSGFRLNVDGTAGISFENVPLLSKDSLFIFIEATFKITEDKTEFLNTDDLIFEQEGRSQKVSLVSLVKDAIFLYPNKEGNTPNTITLFEHEDETINLATGFQLSAQQLKLTNSKPYVVYGYAMVPEYDSLVIEAGARLFFHQNSGIYVSPNASLHVNGSISSDSLKLEKEVIFAGDRLGSKFNHTTGQWGGVYIEKGSNGNTINNLTLKNSINGITVRGNANLDKPQLVLNNTKIYNSLYYNLRASSTNLSATNLILGSSGHSSLVLEAGGTYNFTHVTIGNYWATSFRQGFALYLSDDFVWKPQESQLTVSTNANFENTIVYGSKEKEIMIENMRSNFFEYLFTHCLIKIDPKLIVNPEPPYFLKDEKFFINNIVNEDPLFKNFDNNDYRLEPTSPAIDKAHPDLTQKIPADYLGNERGKLPDMGAHEFQWSSSSKN